MNAFKLHFILLVALNIVIPRFNSVAQEVTELNLGKANNTDQLIVSRNNFISKGISTKPIDLELAKNGIFYPVQLKQKNKVNSKIIEFEMLSTFDQRTSEIFVNRIQPIHSWVKKISIKPNSYKCVIEIERNTSEVELNKLLIHFHYNGIKSKTNNL
jgi:hypothetical protein